MPAEPLQILIDSREQQPWTFARETAAGKVEVSKQCLSTGDYSLRGLEGLVAVERKSISDLWGCCGRGRRRFRAQFQRLAELRYPLVIIEGTIEQIANHPHRGRSKRRLTAASVIGTMVSWSAELRVPWLAGGSIREAERLAFLHLRAADRLR